MQSIQKTVFLIPANVFKIYLVRKEYCIARHDENMCFLLNCRYHNIPIEDIKLLLRKLDAFCFNYQQVDCLFTLFKYQLRGGTVVKSGQLIDNLQRAVHFNQQNRGVDRMPSIAKKGIMMKSSKSIYSAPFKRQKQRRPVVQCLQKELKESKRLN